MSIFIWSTSDQEDSSTLTKISTSTEYSHNTAFVHHETTSNAYQKNRNNPSKSEMPISKESTYTIPSDITITIQPQQRGTKKYHVDPINKDVVYPRVSMIPSESPGSLVIGSLCWGIVIVFILCIIILDFDALIRDVKFTVGNIKSFVRSLRRV